MNTRLVLIALIILSFVPIVFAQGEQVDVISITSMGTEEFDRKKQEIEQILADGKLSVTDKQSLEALRAKAVSVAAMNEECRSFDISSVPNERCKTFYRIELPEFEAAFGQVTSNLYLNRLSMVSGLRNRMDQINACVSAMSAFVNPSTRLQNLVQPKVIQSGLEPVDNSTAEFYYGFEVGVDIQKLQSIKELADRWGKTCVSVVKHPVNNILAPFFVNSVGEKFRKTGFKIEVDSMHLQLRNKGVFEYGYTLNEKRLLRGEVSPLFEGGGVHFLTVDVVPGGLRTDMKLKALSSKMFRGQVRIPLKDSSGVKVSWKVERTDTTQAVVESPPVAETESEPLAEATPESNADVAPVAGSVAEFGPSVPAEAIPTLPKSAGISTMQKIGWVLVGSSGFCGGAGFWLDGKVKSARDEWDQAVATQNATGLVNSGDSLDKSVRNRNAAYGAGVGTFLVGALMIFLGGN